MSQTKVQLPPRSISAADESNVNLGNSSPAHGTNTVSVKKEPESDLQDMYQNAFRSKDMNELGEILQRAATDYVVNVNIFDREGQTALHQCCLDGNLELVKLLVKSGANIHLSNRDGWSALHIAAFGGHQDIAVYLMSNSRVNHG